MMKLQAKMHQSDSSKFHTFMTKGFSVQNFCIKGRITEDVAHEMLSKKGDDQGDYQMVWIDSFPSNTVQGGSKILSSIEANLTLSKKYSLP